MLKITLEKSHINAIYVTKHSCKKILTQHVKNHSGENLYQCNLCEKVFSQKAYLTEHTRIHTGETPYQCIQCPFAFSQQNHLKKHIKIHSGDKQY